MCGSCDVCEVRAKVHDFDGSLELHIEAFTEDFLCLPPQGLRSGRKDYHLLPGGRGPYSLAPLATPEVVNGEPKEPCLPVKGPAVVGAGALRDARAKPPLRERRAGPL